MNEYDEGYSCGYDEGFKCANDQATAIQLLKKDISEFNRWFCEKVDEYHGAFYLNLDKQDLSGLNLSGVDLRWARLRGANLTDTNLSGTDLWWADLSDVVGLTQEQLDSCETYKDAILPDYITKNV